MSLFNSILSAINSPTQQASSSQLGNILDTVQQLSGNHHTNPSAVQSATSIVGKYVRSALQEKRRNEGDEQVQSLVNQFGGIGASSQVVNMLFSAPQIQKLVGEITSKTGINAGIIQAMLPTLVPVVLNFLKTGTNTQNPLGSNSVLSGFLDADGDGDVDIYDAMQLASRYLGR